MTHSSISCAVFSCAHSVYLQHFHRTALIQAIWLPLEILYFLQINIYSWQERNAHFERFSPRPECLPADLTTTTREQSAYMNINLRRVNEHYTYNALGVEWSWPVSHQCCSLSLAGPYKPHREVLISIADDSWRKWIDWINGEGKSAAEKQSAVYPDRVGFSRAALCLSYIFQITSPSTVLSTVVPFIIFLYQWGLTYQDHALQWQNDGSDYTAVKCVDIFALYISQCCLVSIFKKELLLSSVKLLHKYFLDYFSKNLNKEIILMIKYVLIQV